MPANCWTRRQMQPDPERPRPAGGVEPGPECRGASHVAVASRSAYGVRQALSRAGLFGTPGERIGSCAVNRVKDQEQRICPPRAR